MLSMSRSQVVSGILIGQDRLVVMAGAESTLNTWFLCVWCRSSHYYEQSSPQQNPLDPFYTCKIFRHTSGGSQEDRITMRLLDVYTRLKMWTQSECGQDEDKGCTLEPCINGANVFIHSWIIFCNIQLNGHTISRGLVILNDHNFYLLYMWNYLIRLLIMFWS